MFVAVPAAALAFALAVSVGARSQATSTAPVGAEPAARVVHAPGGTLSGARLARSAVSWAGGPMTTAGGETVTVYVSAGLPPELGTPQIWAEFLAGLVHGPELSALTAYIATFAEMQEICGEYALGCYSADRMVSMGETAFGVTAAEVVRHEYGHHIALHRVNAPWQAIAWGPKNWASTENVCRREDDGTAYPGNEGDHYSLNPGEAWAETYRLLDEQKAGAAGSGWQIIDSSFYPDEAALRAAEQDVLQPWASPTKAVYKARFTQRGMRVWTIPITTPLDGSIEVTVTLPVNGLHGVALVDSDRTTIVATGLWAGRAVKRITTTVCGQRSLFVRVTQRGAFGRVAVTTSTP